MTVKTADVFVVEMCMKCIKVCTKMITKLSEGAKQ